MHKDCRKKEGTFSSSSYGKSLFLQFGFLRGRKVPGLQTSSKLLGTRPTLSFNRVDLGGLRNLKVWLGLFFCFLGPVSTKWKEKRNTFQTKERKKNFCRVKRTKR